MKTTTSTCWSCGHEHAAEDPICPACGKVQPPAGPGAQLDKFALLGLTPSFDEPPGLGDQFRSLSRKLHPDRFARATPQERRYSLEQTTLLNDAYKTIKDPVRRAEHLLALRGIKGDPKMSPDFLEQTLEDREKLAEAKLSGQPLDGLAADVREKRDRTLQQVKALVENGGDLARAAELLARMRYYARYLDEVEGRSVEI
ncbi:MAG TPA: Fe-S protein assembly co-chaperone HscB [Myxococcales bacterium]|nr:Fe-S protein assembly co-chaperone HscB [Myxococcales bacterium]